MKASFPENVFAKGAVHELTSNTSEVATCKKSFFLNPKQGYKYLSRKEVCQILKVSLPTISDWSKRGLINSYRIGKRVLYRSDEVDDALVKRKFQY